MKKIYVLFLLLTVSYAGVSAQQADSTMTKKAPAKKSEPSRVYYGGNIGLNFGDYFRISVAPMIGYILSPKTSVGAKIGYEYIEDKRYQNKRTYNNYGGSLFFRYRVIPQAYLHAEFAYMSYKYSVETQLGEIDSDRQWVPFLLLGAGYVQPVSTSTSLFVEVLFDVLNDPNSPYEKGSPWISIGVGVGF
jgi:outer membrane protein assembly factor BamA